MKKVFNIETMDNQALRSDYWHGKSVQDSKFFEVSKYEFNIERYSPSEGLLIRYNFSPSAFNIKYQRTTFNMFTALSQLGGL